MIQGIIFTIGMVVVLVVMMVVFTIHSIIKLFFPEKESQKKIQQPTVIDMGTGSWIWIPKVEEKIIAVEEDEPKKLNILQRVAKTIQDIIVFIIKTILIIILVVEITLLIGIAIGFIVDYIRNPSL